MGATTSMLGSFKVYRSFSDGDWTIIPFVKGVENMKVFFILTAAVLFSASSLAQGTLIFNNRTQTGDAPFSFGNGRGVGSVPGMTAQLYLVGAGGALTPLYPTTTFRTESEAAMYFVKPINPFVVQGVLPGQSATFRMVVYQGPSYEAAVASGCLFHLRSGTDVTVSQLGGTLPNGQVIPPPDLNGLQGAMLLAPWPPQYIMFRDVSIEADQLRFNLDENFEEARGCWGNYVLEASRDSLVWQPPFLTNPPPSFTIPYNPATERNRFFRLRTIQ